MEKQFVRKRNRIKNFDYSSPGAYFVTICTANREKCLWDKCNGDLWPPLSELGMIVQREIQKLDTVYSSIHIDKFTIMPDHIHMIILIETSIDESVQDPPSLSRVIQQFKGIITKQIGRSLWQKSFYDHGIRSQQDYEEIWQYIHNNPFKYLIKK